MSAGAEKSGKPCDKLTAPCFNASRVISRITDSVNKLALRDTWRLLVVIGVVIGQEKVTQTGTQMNADEGGLRNDLFTSSFAFQLFQDGANRRRIAAVGRQLEIFFVGGHSFLRLFNLFVSRS